MSAHTPGPWHTGGTFNPDTNPRQNVWGPTPTGASSGEIVARDMRPPNASMAAAAPDLLTALLQYRSERLSHRDCEVYLAAGRDGRCETCQLADAAIAKAEGRTA